MDIDTLSIIFLQQFRNPIFDTSSIFFNLFFSWPIILGISLIIYFFYKRRKFFVVFSASLLTFVLSYILKEVIARPRPAMEIASLIVGASGPSFPSAHTAIAFMLAILLSKYYPKYRLTLYVAAVFTAFTRIYSGSHYISDVIAGVVLGILVAYAFLLKEENILALEAKIHKQLKSTFKL